MELKTKGFRVIADGEARTFKRADLALKDINSINGTPSIYRNALKELTYNFDEETMPEPPTRAEVVAKTKEKIAAKSVKKKKASATTTPEQAQAPKEETVNKLTEDKDDAPLPEKKSTLYEDDDTGAISGPLSGYGNALDGYDGSKADPVEDVSSGYLNEDGDWVEGKKVETTQKATPTKSNKKKSPMLSEVKEDEGSEYDAKDEGATEKKEPVENKEPEPRENAVTKSKAAKVKSNAYFKKRVMEVFGKKSQYTTLDSGNIIVVTPNGSAILVRQKDTIIADEATGKMAHGAWSDSGVLAENYGVKIERGGMLELAKLREKTTLDHEQFHAAVSLALSSVDRKLLFKRYGKEGMTRRDVEEAIAKDYQKWNPKSANQGWQNRVRNTWRNILELFTEVDPTTIDDVFKKMRNAKAWETKDGGRGVKRDLDSSVKKKSDVDATGNDNVTTAETEESTPTKASKPLYSLIEDSYGIYDGMMKDHPENADSIRKILGPDKRGGFTKTLAVLRNIQQGDKDELTHYKDLLFGHIRQNVFDIYDRVKVLGKQVDEALDTDIGEVAYKTMRLTSSIDSVMSAILQHGKIKWEDGVSKLVDVEGKGLIPLIEEMGEDFGFWLGERVGKRAKSLKEQGRENLFTDDDINNFLTMAEPRRKANSEMWEKADEQFNEIQQSILDFAVASGTISRESVEAWHSADYIPFYRILTDAFGDNKESVVMPNGKEIVSGIRKLKGGKAELDDVLTNVVKNWSLLVGQAIKNNSRVKAIDMALMFGDDVVQKTHSGRRGEKSVVNIMRDGKHEYYEVKDAYFLQALTATPMGMDKNGMIRLAQQSKRLLTFAATVSFAFRSRNFIRDTIQTMALNKGYGLSDAIQGAKSAWNMDEDMLQLMASGGSFSNGYLRGSDPDSVTRYVEHVVTKNGKATVNKLTPAKLLDWWSRVGDAAENANRVGLYKKLKAEGKSDLDAAYEAKDLLDFSMRGGSRSLAMATSVIPFFNARLAGLYKVGREMGSGANGRVLDWQKVGRMVGMLTTTSLALMAYNMGANKDEWDKLPYHEKWTYYNFWIGKERIRIPKPFELGAIFSSLPEMMIESMDKKDAEIVGKFLGFTLNDTLSFGWPQIVKPAVELWANKNSYTGRDIVPQGMEFLAPEMQYTESTKEVYKKLGEMFGMSPAKIEHVVNGYLSNLSMAFATTADLALEYSTITPSKPFNRNNLWVLGGAIRDDGMMSAQAVTDFYDYARKVDEAVYSMNALKKEGDVTKLRDYVAENLDLIKDRTVVSKLKKEFSTIRTKRMAIIRSRDLSTTEKDEQLRALVKRRNGLAKTAVEYFKQEK